MAYLDIDTDTFRSLVTTAKQTNDAISEALSLLNQVVIHNDWQCRERDQINKNTEENRSRAQTIQEYTSRFYDAIEKASAKFDETEQNNITKMNQVDSLLGEILSVVPGISAGANAPAMVSFENLKDSLSISKGE